MGTEGEIRFGGGVPVIPPPEVFKAAAAQNPLAFQVLEKAYVEFATRPENRGLYGDPEKGATLSQCWRVYTLFGVKPHCVLARELPKDETDAIPMLTKQTPSELIALLRRLDAHTGSLNVPTLHYDGKTGHSIRLTRYQPLADRFVYHDPWPDGSLLMEKNNVAGVSARPEGSRWSVTSAELEKVIFASFFMPAYWTRLDGVEEPVPKQDLPYADWFRGEFRRFFALEELEHRTDRGLELRRFAPQNFRDEVAVIVKSDGSGRVSGAILALDRRWLEQQFILALDVTKSFILAFAPATETKEYSEVSSDLWSHRDRESVRRLIEAGEPQSGSDRLLFCLLGAPVHAEIVHPRSSLSARNVGEPGAYHFELTVELT